MTVSYDKFTAAFLAKITEYDLLDLELEERQALVDGYMKRAAAQFSEYCVYNIAIGDNETREYTFNGATENDVEEIVDIVSDGMVVQWLRQHLYKQENLSITMNTQVFGSAGMRFIKHLLNCWNTLRAARLQRVDEICLGANA